MKNMLLLPSSPALANSHGCNVTLESWGKSRVGSVDVICPGFPADCLETVEEIAMQNRNLFLAAGGTQFRYIPALNDSDAHIQALAQITIEHL
jgi:ferrochelatase